MGISVTKDVWKERMGNLMNRRKEGVKDGHYSNSKEVDYDSHFTHCRLGESVLDIGCGDAFVKKYCTGDYVGIDAFPINENIIKAEIETFVSEKKYETLVAFQVLDGLYDLRKATQNMKLLCERNIIMMVRFGIPPDQYHTIEITEDLLNDLMMPEFIQSYREELRPKIFLIEYSVNVR